MINKAQMLGPKTRFSTVEEVASVLRVSKMTVYRMIEEGELFAVQVGRSYRVPTQEVWNFLSGNVVRWAEGTPINEIAPYAKGIHTALEEA